MATKRENGYGNITKYDEKRLIDEEAILLQIKNKEPNATKDQAVKFLVALRIRQIEEERLNTLSE